MVDLSVDLGFLKLKNPVLGASGTFGYGLEFKPFYDLELLGGFVVKGLYLKPREGNRPPRLVETPAGLINSIGLQGIGVEAFCRDILPELSGLKTAIIVNVCGEEEDEYARVAEYLSRHQGIAALELNISCPNVREGGRCPAQSPEATYRTVKKVKQAVSLPLITKLSPNVTDITAVALAAEEAGTEAISLINTLLAMAIDPETRQPKLGNVMGGLSGPAIKPIALRMVFQVARAVKVPLIGLGGIFSAEDVLEFMMAGASAVQVGTANFVDPDACLNIIRGLETWAENHGLQNLSQVTGSLKV
ncbi:MAG: dihydroorotate dehydrogenase [Candidatus Saccharicenans sp.]|nr:dihydroorotate dehydrogenase [Candidatus Saccharicenans sp.]MDI6849816.1 dihydroorotate dehydrogenase [Candidatus Saccharicenans sp.]